MAEILILCILGAVAFVMAKYDKFQVVKFEDGDIKVNEGVKEEGYTTVALFGGDSRDGALEAGTHTDCIIIASIKVNVMNYIIAVEINFIIVFVIFSIIKRFCHKKYLPFVYKEP